jgi:hypothetical protein
MRLALTIAVPLAAGAYAASEGTVARIDMMMAEIQRQMDPSDIEIEGRRGCGLDDAICADGPYDIDLDENLAVTERRKE